MSAASPSSSQASSSYNAVELCITSVEDIRAQLLDQDEEVRFRCLAFDKRSSPRTRCFESSKTFERDHPILHNSAVKALNIKPQNITAEEFRCVVRILFCNKHHEERQFRPIFDLIEPKWSSSGIAKKTELLEAIRHRHNPIQRPVAEETVESSIPASPPATPPPKKATRSANRPQSFLQTPKEPEDYTHSHYTRSKSNSGNRAYRQEEPSKHQSIESDFTQEMAFVPSNSSGFKSPSPVLGPSIELPLRSSRQLRSSNGLVMSPKNTPKSKAHSRGGQAVASRAVPDDASSSTSLLNPPSQTFFSISLPKPQSQVTVSWPQTPNANKLGSPESPSQSTSIFGTESLSRRPAVSHEQSKSVSEPLIPTSGVFSNTGYSFGQLSPPSLAKTTRQDVPGPVAELYGKQKSAAEAAFPTLEALGNSARPPLQPSPSSTQSLTSQHVSAWPPTNSAPSQSIPTSTIFTKATGAPGKSLLSPAPDGSSQKVPEERGQQSTPASKPEIPMYTSPTNPVQPPWQALSSLADDTLSIRTTLTAEATTTASRCSRPSTAQSYSTPKSASRVSSSSVDWDGDRPSIGHPSSAKENGLKLDEISKQYGRIAAASSPPPTHHSTEHTNLMQAQNPVAKEIRDPLRPQGAKFLNGFRRSIRKSRGQGRTYILRDPKYFESYDPPLPPLVKLVMSGSMEGEKRKLEEECHMTDISYIVDGQEMAIDNYEKVEKIVHAALQNFHRDFKCQRCQREKDDVDWNRDWFDLSGDVVLATVRLWRRFALQDPWDKHGNLKEYWRKMLEHEEMALLKDEERLDDAKDQNERWGKWLDGAIEGSPEKMVKEGYGHARK